MKTINKEWLEFKKAVLPENSEESKIKNVKATFYAGAAITLQIIESISEMDTDEAIKHSDKLCDDIDSFFEDKYIQTNKDQ